MEAGTDVETGLPSPSGEEAARAVARMRVLVIEPDPLSARILKAKLESWNFVVQVEQDGRAAMEWLAAQPYRIVLFNLEDPRAGGLETCRKLRSLPLPRYTYVIGFAANGGKRLLVDAFDAGVDDVAMKPFHVPELRMRVNRARQAIEHEDALFMGGGTCPSTGLLNRSAFAQFLRVILAQARRTGTRAALVFVRIENAQDIFRRHGYQALHDLVRELSTRLPNVHRTSDLLAKTRDDEFCMLLQNTQWDLCRPVVEKIEAISREVAVEVRGQPVRPRLAISVVNFPGDGDSVESLLRGDGAIRLGDAEDDPPAPDSPIVIV